MHLFAYWNHTFAPKLLPQKKFWKHEFQNTVVLDRQHQPKHLTLMKQKESVTWKKVSSLTVPKWSSQKSVTWKHSTNLSLGKHSSLSQFQTEVHTKKSSHLKILFISTFQMRLTNSLLTNILGITFPITYCANFQQII
jgi:hypothetical protein